MSVDFSQEQRWDPDAADLISVGKHWVTITEAATGKSSGGYSQIELRIETGDGSNLRQWFVIHPAALGKVLMLTQAAGLPNPGAINADDPDDPDWKAYVAQLIGKRLGVKVIDEERNDDPTKTRRAVSAWWHADEFTAQHGADIPVDTAGLATQGSATQDPDIPF